MEPKAKEINMILENFKENGYDYLCIDDIIRNMLFLLVAERKITQDSYDLLCHKLDILRRKFEASNNKCINLLSTQGAK